MPNLDTRENVGLNFSPAFERPDYDVTGEKIGTLKKNY